jgi:hypothetical protein
MARCRSILALSLVALWLAAPALACLPNAQMTPAEMACCKKMAGDCHMGAAQHPCCNIVKTAPQPVASMQAVSQIQAPVAVVAEIAVVSVSSATEAEAMQVGLGLPPPAPPCLHSILRI